jgi:hypothetical protein
MKVFEIPIYICSQKKYNEYCESEKKKWCQNILGDSQFNQKECEDKYDQYLKWKGWHSWRYNFIIGFIQVNISKRLEKIKVDGILYFTTKKVSLKSRHVSISSDPEPIFEIEDSPKHSPTILTAIEKELKTEHYIRFLNGVDKKINLSKYYVDVECFKNFFKLVDWKNL